MKVADFLVSIISTESPAKRLAIIQEYVGGADCILSSEEGQRLVSFYASIRDAKRDAGVVSRRKGWEVSRAKKRASESK